MDGGLRYYYPYTDNVITFEGNGVIDIVTLVASKVTASRLILKIWHSLYNYNQSSAKR